MHPADDRAHSDWSPEEGPIVDFVGGIINIRFRVRGHEPAPEPLMMKRGQRTEPAGAKSLKALAYYVPVRTGTYGIDRIHETIP